MGVFLLSLVLLARAEPPADPAAAAKAAAERVEQRAAEVAAANQVADMSPEDRAWAVATSRMLGAAGTVRDRAWNLGRTADALTQRQRMGGMSALASDARALNQAVSSASLAAEVLVEKSLPAAD